MKRLCFLLLLLPTLAQAQGMLGRHATMAETIRKGYNAHDYGLVFNLFNEAMATAVPKATLSRYLTDMQAEAGEWKSVRVTDTTRAGIAHVVCTFAHMKAHMDLALDGGNLVSGLVINPVEDVNDIAIAPVQDPPVGYEPPAPSPTPHSSATPPRSTSPPTEAEPKSPAPRSATALAWPFKRKVLTKIAWGGPTRAQNYHAVVPEQRYAIDILGDGADGASHTGSGTALTDYPLYGVAVLAPAAGIIMQAVDSFPDNAPGQGNPKSDPTGNYIVIHTTTGEYVFLDHLQHGSVRTRVGRQVKAGARLAKVGNSGNTTEPHLHLQVMAASMLTAPQQAALLPVFQTVKVNGETKQNYSPVKGDVVQGE